MSEVEYVMLFIDNNKYMKNNDKNKESSDLKFWDGDNFYE